MNNFKNIGRGLALASTTLALGSAMAVSSNISSAQAAVIFTPGTTSVINFTGGATLTPLPTVGTPNPNPVNITFGTGTVNGGTFTTNDFIPLVGTAVNISNVNLTNPVGPVGPNAYNYTGTAANTNPFITFAQNVVFQLTSNPFTVNSLVIPSGNPSLPDAVSLNISKVTGTFFDTITQSAIGDGLLTINQIATSGSYSATLVAFRPQGTPEPTATAGLAVLGLGALFTKNNFAKKKKAAVNA